MRDRVWTNAPSVAGAVTTTAVAALSGNPRLAIGGVARTVADVATNLHSGRRLELEALERGHDRTLAMMPDRSAVEGGRLQSDIEHSYRVAADFAEGALGDRSLMDRTVTPDPERTAGTNPIPESEANALRGEVKQRIDRIIQRLGTEPIDHLRRLTELPGDRYRLVVGRGVKPVLHVEVGHTPDPSKIEVRYTEGQITLRVPPELGHPGADLHTAVRDALAAVAERQHMINLDRSLVVRFEKSMLAQGLSALPLFLAGENLVARLGTVITSSGAARTIVQLIADRVMGRRTMELDDLRWQHDSRDRPWLDDDVRRTIGNQIVDLAHNGRDLAQSFADRLDGTHPGPRPGGQPAVSPGHRAVAEAIQRTLVGRQHGGGSVRIETHDAGNSVTEVRYRIERPGWARSVELRLHFRDGGEGGAVTPTDDRIRFSPAASSAGCGRTTTRAGSTSTSTWTPTRPGSPGPWTGSPTTCCSIGNTGCRGGSGSIRTCSRPPVGVRPPWASECSPRHRSACWRVSGRA
ncbi:hypothetical protein GCM10027605_58520 [Micromonospora zhanjiangensis]